jgi:hypothetical protein
MRPEHTDTDVDQPDGTLAGESRALVALSHLSEPSERAAGYRSAPFVAQLVATKDQHPQTRERRRAEPDVVLAAYRATAALTAA